jgi:hypothetical protein
VVSEDGIIFPGQDAVAGERLARATWVLVRRDGGWRIASHHNSPATPEARPCTRIQTGSRAQQRLSQS